MSRDWVRPEGFQFGNKFDFTGDGSANIRIDIIVDVPIDRLIDLSVNSEDILVNNKPFTLLSDDDISAEEPHKDSSFDY